MFGNTNRFESMIQLEPKLWYHWRDFKRGFSKYKSSLRKKSHWNGSWLNH